MAKPNIKQKKVLKNIMENNGNVSKAMKDAGYSANYSKNPQTLLRTKSFQELMEELGMTDDYLLKKHLELMEHSIKGKLDPQARKAALEMAYKLKGSFAPEKKDVSLNLESEEEIDARIQELINRGKERA